MQSQISSSSVNVEVEGGPQADLTNMIDEIRSQYEGIAEKNRLQMETWYKAKVRGARCHISPYKTTLI